MTNFEQQAKAPTRTLPLKSEEQPQATADAQIEPLAPAMSTMIDGNRNDDRFRFFTLQLIDTNPVLLIDMEQRITNMLNEGWSLIHTEKMGNNEHTITLGFWMMR